MSDLDSKKIKALFENPESFQLTPNNINFPFQCYFVGGRLENIKEVILPALKKELGMNLTMIGHKDPTKKTMPTIPFTSMLVFHLKDMSGHAIREWAKKEADDLGVPFIEIVQKIKPTIETLQKHYPNFWTISQRFKMLRSLIPAEDCKKEEDFFVFTIESLIKSLLEKEEWLSIEKSCMDKPYKIMPVNVNNENPIDFYKSSIKTNINYFLSGLEYENQKSDVETLTPRVENWYQQGGDLLADQILSVIQGRSSRYTKEQNIEVKRHWLIDMITDPTLDKEWTKNFHKIDLAFKGVFGGGIPSILKNEVKEMVEMKYQDEYKDLKPHHIEEPIIAAKENLDAIINTPVIEQPKEETIMEKNPTQIEEPRLLKNASINGMKFQMLAGAVISIENIQISDLDLKECSQVILKNVNENKVGELKIVF